jgi:hypothetical protein
MENRTGNLPPCSIVPQPTPLPRAPTWSTGYLSLQFLNLRELTGLFERGISPTQGCYLYTWQQKHNINAKRQPWDSNLRSQHSSERRQFMSQTPRPLWSACFTSTKLKRIGSDSVQICRNSWRIFFTIWSISDDSEVRSTLVYRWLATMIPISLNSFIFKLAVEVQTGKRDLLNIRQEH